MKEQLEFILPEDIQVKYQKLYTIMRDYIWEFDVVKALAQLEVSVYQKFPNKEDMQNNLETLDVSIRDTYSELSQADDEAFQKAYEQLESYIEQYDETRGCEIYSVVEVPTDIDIDSTDDADANDSTSDSGKRKFTFGDITKEPNDGGNE